MRNYLYVILLALMGRAQPKPRPLDGGGPPTPPDFAPPPKQ